MNTLDADVIVVGAGFAGLRTIYTMRQHGYSVIALETGDDVGGVWFWNRYPGARCDVVSYDYSYSFDPELEQEWRWSERYATQPEILEYIQHVANRYDLRKHIQFQQSMVAADWDEAHSRWHVTTASGRTLKSRYLVMATGQLSIARQPEFDGIQDYAGTVVHTGAWPVEGLDVSGRRVAVIGTGSSGVQVVPALAETAEIVTVYQRTPAYSVPANNSPISDADDQQEKGRYAERRDAALRSANGMGIQPDRRALLSVDEGERMAILEDAYANAGFGFALAFHDILVDEDANEFVAKFMADKIRGRVKDPVIAERLTPSGYPFGAKRPAVDSGFYESFNRDNVKLVDLRQTPLERFTNAGIRTADQEREFDVVVMATGYDALTGSLLKPTITGLDGQTLAEAWEAGPRTYLGLSTLGFPNMFVIAGPGSPSVLANVLLGIEVHVDWIAKLMEYAASRGESLIEVTPRAQDEWVEEVNAKAQATLYLKAASWYLGANVPGKPRVFMPYAGGLRAYRRKLLQVAAEGYPGFAFDSASAATGALSSEGARR